MSEKDTRQSESTDSFIKGLFSVDLTGLLVVGSLTAGYIWLQISGQEVDGGYAVLLAFVLSLYFAGRKRQIEKPAQPEAIRYVSQHPSPLPQPVAPCCCGRSTGNSGVPNISITVNGEKACVEGGGVTADQPQSTELVGKDDKCFYRIYKDKAEKYRWQLKTRVTNQEGELVDEIIGTSHQGFKTVMECLNEVYRVMGCCYASIVQDTEDGADPTVIQVRPVGIKRNVPYVDRTNFRRQEFLSGRFDENE